MRKRTISSWATLCLCVCALSSTPAGRTAAAADVKPVSAERAVVNSIVEVGFNHSELPETAEYLADQIGGRMTNSPAMRRAERWAT